MALDGELLRRARERLAERRRANTEEHRSRQVTAWAAMPELRELDKRQREMLGRVLGITLRREAEPEKALREIEDQVLALQARKAELLSRARLPEDYLEDIVTCPRCRDSGNAPDGRPCACLMELYREEQARDLSSLLRVQMDDFSQFRLDYYDNAPGPGGQLSPRQMMSMVLETCRRYAETFGQGAKNLLFRGGTGLGKTFLSACIAREVAGRGFSVVYDTAVSAFEAFEHSKFRSGEEAAAGGEKARRILSCDLMILDDLGTEMTTSFTQSALYTIINTRLNEGKKTIVSTNLTAGEMAGRYTPQTVSRLEGEYDVLPFIGRDIRAIRKEDRYK